MTQETTALIGLAEGVRSLKSAIRRFLVRHIALMVAAIICAAAYGLHVIGANATAIFFLSLALISFADAWDEETMRGDIIDLALRAHASSESTNHE